MLLAILNTYANTFKCNFDTIIIGYAYYFNYVALAIYALLIFNAWCVAPHFTTVALTTECTALMCTLFRV